ncbi:Ribonuclease III [Lachnospiraceae bacterium TWA4]|nr:Ribonuclease III [Lachnospiraceae bacterium TWA4]
MDQSIENTRKHFLELLDLKEVDIRTYSPLSLAFIGDGVYELVVRTIIVHQGSVQVHKLNDRSSKWAKATTQCELVRTIEGDLTKDEYAVFKRGMNAKPHSKAKNASVKQYLEATGLEALVGYLYLTGQYERLLTLIKQGMDRVILEETNS